MSKSTKLLFLKGSFKQKRIKVWYSKAQFTGLGFWGVGLGVIEGLGV